MSVRSSAAAKKLALTREVAFAKQMAEGEMLLKKVLPVSRRHRVALSLEGGKMKSPAANSGRQQGEYAIGICFGSLEAQPVSTLYRGEQATCCAGGHDLAVLALGFCSREVSMCVMERYAVPVYTRRQRKRARMKYALPLTDDIRCLVKRPGWSYLVFWCRRAYLL